MPEPITEPHKAFAAELVTLARKHGANHLSVSFSLTGSKMFRNDEWNNTDVRFDWCEGRHGDRSRYTLRSEAVLHVEEALP
jgi:hypothetical protein